MTETDLAQSRFLRACRRQPTDTTPIWLMRQAGRYMSEYRQLRQSYGILELIKTPELACEVTMQPINSFDLDAAIIFADILPPLEGMGLSLEFVKGEGPVMQVEASLPDEIDTTLASLEDHRLWAGDLMAVRRVVWGAPDQSWT
ncbi:MAG: uroporphyrinogen decarboxylase family protein, partial [Candidatus Promineifilaceae bacterium]